MLRRSLTFCALASAVLLAACGEDSDLMTATTGSTATVRFVNATGNSNISVASNGTVATGNSALGFGSGSTCMTVNTASPGLTFTNSSTNATLSGFTPNFTAGGNYTVVAYTDASGNTQFATLNNAYTPTSGQAGIRVFNAAPTSGNIVVLNNGTALNSGTTTSFGNGGTFFSMPAGAQTFTFNTGTGTSTLATTSGVTLTSGQNGTLVLGPAATGSTALRTFFTPGC